MVPGPRSYHRNGAELRSLKWQLLIDPLANITSRNLSTRTFLWF
jgi:hypothetical protein